MSAIAVATSCAVGAGVFAWAYATTKPRKGEEASDLLLSAKFASIISGAFAVLAFFFACFISGASLSDVLLAEVPGRQVRKGVYLAYGSLTVSLLFCIAFVVRKLRSAQRSV